MLLAKDHYFGVASAAALLRIFPKPWCRALVKLSDLPYGVMLYVCHRQYSLNNWNVIYVALRSYNRFLKSIQQAGKEVPGDRLNVNALALLVCFLIQYIMQSEFHGLAWPAVQSDVLRHKGSPVTGG